ncbi:Mitochondrial distribution and morphology protein 10, partial [Spiromyces aspiralis]
TTLRFPSISLNTVLMEIRNGVWRTNWSLIDGTSRGSIQKSTTGDYLMMAQLSPKTRSISGQYAQRITPSCLLWVRGLSVASARQQLQLITHLIQDRDKWCTEYLFASQGSILGIRALYNFGDYQRADDICTAFRKGSTETRSEIYARGLNGKVSVGGEAYLGLQNTSPGGK